MSKQVIVIGSGAWGTTLSQLLCDHYEQVVIGCHDGKIIQEINRHRTNTQYLPATPKLKANISAVGIDEISFETATDVVIAVATQYYRSILERIQKSPSVTRILSATKGMEVESNKSCFEMAEDVLSQAQLKHYAILSGPNLASEIYMGKPAVSVVAAQDENIAVYFQEALSSERFRVYISSDLKGGSYGGILKNIIAIVAGIVDAKAYGNNAKAALLVRGMAEIRRYATHCGAQPETLYGLAGFGDLLTTCIGPASRNYTVGFQIGKGKSLSRILAEMNSVAEGINSCKVIYKLSQQHRIPMPITQAVYEVLFNEKDVDEALNDLMTRDLKAED